MHDLTLFPPSIELIRMQQITVSLITIIYIIILIFVIQQNIITKDQQKLQIKLSYSIICLVAFNLINHIYTHLIIYDFVTYNCHLLITVSSITLLLTRLSLYNYAINRAEVIFHKSIGLQYSRKTIISSKITIIFIIIIICGIFTIPFDDLLHHDHNDHHHNETEYIYHPMSTDMGMCEVRYPLWILAITGLGDNMANMYCFWLFWNRMQKLIASTNKIIKTIAIHNIYDIDKDLVKSQIETVYIVRKCTILFFITLVTTWISLACITVTPLLYMVTSIDSLINTNCLLLQDCRYDKLYRIICKCIIRHKSPENMEQQLSNYLSELESTMKNKSRTNSVAMEDPHHDGHVRATTMTMTTTTSPNSDWHTRSRTNTMTTPGSVMSEVPDQNTLSRSVIVEKDGKYEIELENVNLGTKIDEDIIKEMEMDCDRVNDHDHNRIESDIEINPYRSRGISDMSMAGMPAGPPNFITVTTVSFCDEDPYVGNDGNDSNNSPSN